MSQPTLIQNPVLPGFHPDPSILRVGSDYYIATSTFEWWPGVRIHHSRDLVTWCHHSYALTRSSQLDLRGDPDSCGVWAPCLSYGQGRFWLVFTNVRSLAGAYKDAHNYVVTAPSIDGPWSEPTYLNSSGFDPSFFHDDDGRTWLLNMQWSHLADYTHFAGILLQEFSRETGRLVGPVHRIFTGSELGLTEGPHLYKRNGWYYLVVAEGGTGFEHAVTVARSRSITGPYQLSPHHPLLTSFGKPLDRLQRAGHGSLVETPEGETYLAHLCSRPIECAVPARDAQAKGYHELHCVLGRETALQQIQWTESGWPVCAHGDNAPAWQVPAPQCAQGVPAQRGVTEQCEDFDHPWLPAAFNSLRVPFDSSWLSLDARPGYLRLHGRESLMSTHCQSLVMRRQQSLHCEAETRLEFAPRSFQQMAGLLAYYNTQNHAYLCLSHDERRGTVLRLLGNDNGVYREWVAAVPLPVCAAVRLRVQFSGVMFQFAYAVGEGAWRSIGPALPARMLSDEYATRFEGNYARSFGFTGNFLGMACQDLSGQRLHADFDYFHYRERAVVHAEATSSAVSA